MWGLRRMIQFIDTSFQDSVIATCHRDWHIYYYKNYYLKSQNSDINRFLNEVNGDVSTQKIDQGGEFGPYTSGD
jgi:hypothetical protein